MTDYHPVTREELMQIRTWRKANPLGEGHGSQWLSMPYHEVDAVMEDVLARPDPLALLDKWRDTISFDQWSCGKVWEMERELIKQLRENPEAVRKQGLKKGGG